uniref:Uncharacterized protein n=1 Tax=Amphora coffeiformis TaxID=265554 RepID=A0A7S3KW60_9STRA|mmetsp:Transcript_1167/g.2305  ORF Transcript_1167/g.2305 Transcript_1167/m.2305 type:complete len:204 (+) Transcript_1167:171-782(+)
MALLVSRWRQFLDHGGAAAVLFVGADAAAQYMEQRHVVATTAAESQQQQQLGFQLDQWRCLGATGLGVVLGGAVYPTAYAALDRLLPGRSWRTVVIKSAVEIVTVGIAINTASLVGRAAWQGTQPWVTVADHVRMEIPRVTMTDAHVWFPYNVLAFGMIPIHVRPLTTACMEAAWQTYISWRAHDYSDMDDEESGVLLLKAEL